MQSTKGTVLCGNRSYYNQLHISCCLSDVARAHQRLSKCIADLILWCARRHLCLNAN